MPQMMPLSWFMLFVMFAATFILFNIMSYFNFNICPHNENKTQKQKKLTFNWKW
nr:ATP synthase F0 subunit 8 [Anaplecta sp. 8 ZQW-2020]